MRCGTIKVIGIGNEFRGDDAVGLQVVRRLNENRLPGVEYLQQGGEATALIDALEATDTAIIVDAIQSGADTGQIHRYEISKQPMPAQFLRSSTHNFSVQDAIEMSRILGKLPSRLLVYGIEGSRFDQGTEMSPTLNSAIDQTVQLIYEELMTLTKDTHA